MKGRTSVRKIIHVLFELGIHKRIHLTKAEVDGYAISRSEPQVKVDWASLNPGTGLAHTIVGNKNIHFQFGVNYVDVSWMIQRRETSFKDSS